MNESNVAAYQGKVSIIVPVYNAEKYLHISIESILNQTYNNIEIILINDGSTDNSSQICDIYAGKDSRVHVIHQKNMGVSEARNNGVQMAIGQYLQFVDSDDYVGDNMTEVLVNAMEKNKADLIISGYKIIDQKFEESFYRMYSEDEITLRFDEFLKNFDDLFTHSDLHSPWNKLYIRKMIQENNILFNPDLDLGEDLVFNMEVYSKCNSLSIIPFAPYNHFKYNEGYNLEARYRENFYEIQKFLFERVVEIFKDKAMYANQIKNLENDYTAILISNAVSIATKLHFKYFKKYILQVKNIRSDEILQRRIDKYIISSKQDRMITILFKHRLFTLIFIYAKIKLFIKTIFPRTFKILAEWGRK